MSEEFMQGRVKEGKEEKRKGNLTGVKGRIE